jgi:hypothetical protein
MPWRNLLSLSDDNLCQKGKFQDVNSVVMKYVDLGHAELVADQDLKWQAYGRSILHANLCCVQEGQYHDQKRDTIHNTKQSQNQLRCEL